jgi:hypothetical protein
MPDYLRANYRGTDGGRSATNAKKYKDSGSSKIRNYDPLPQNIG